MSSPPTAEARETDDATDDAPPVCSNSWGSNSRTDRSFWEICQAWRAAGVLPVFAAGNAGPGSKTVGIPGGYPHVFAVGATTRSDGIASFSSRGPSTWDGTDIIVLNDVVAVETDWHLAEATAINNNGVIVGFGAPPIEGSSIRGFMLIPRGACSADLSGNDVVGFEDVLRIIAAWGFCNPGPSCLEDLDNDGDVDFADVLVAIGMWGSCV